ncbi:hypothetical protein Tco_0744423 [Tanacetum coccineum]
MSKERTNDSFYKRIKDVVDDPEIQTQTQTQLQTPKQAQPQTETQTNGDNIIEESHIMEESFGAGVEPETIATSNSNEVNLDFLIRDPGMRPPISSYPKDLGIKTLCGFWPSCTFIPLGYSRLQQLAVKAEICGIMEQLVDWSVSNDHVPPFVAPNLHHDNGHWNGISFVEAELELGEVPAFIPLRLTYSLFGECSYNPCAYLEMKDFEQPVRSLISAVTYAGRGDVMDGSHSSIPFEF